MVDSDVKAELKPLLAKPLMVDNGAKKNLVEGISVGLDLFKGTFVIFMIAEHSRAGLRLAKNTSQLIWFTNNVAHSLDMICYSFAYGFVCYRQYLSDAVPRPLFTKASRMLRSAGLIWCAGIFVDIFFAWITGGRPSMQTLFELATGWQVYWDFIRTFPVMLFTMLLFNPVVELAYSGRYSFTRLLAAASLIVVPLMTSYIHAPLNCETGVARYVPFFVNCEIMSIRASRFPAWPQLANFNLGLLISMLVRRLENVGNLTTMEAEKENHGLLKELSAFMVVTMCVCAAFGIKLLNYWSDHDMEALETGEGIFHFSRWPPSVAWLLGCMAVGFAWFCCTVGIGTFLVNYRDSYARYPLAYFEHLGANVLAYLVMSNILLQASGAFHGFAGEMLTSSEKTEKNAEGAPAYRTAVMLAFIGFVHYLIKGGRK